MLIFHFLSSHVFHNRNSNLWFKCYLKIVNNSIQLRWTVNSHKSSLKTLRSSEFSEAISNFCVIHFTPFTRFLLGNLFSELIFSLAETLKLCQHVVNIVIKLVTQFSFSDFSSTCLRNTVVMEKNVQRNIRGVEKKSRATVAWSHHSLNFRLITENPRKIHYQM